MCKWVFVRGRWPHSSYEARSDYDIQKTLKDPARSIALSPSPFVRTCSLKSPNRSSFSHMRQHSDSPIAWRVCCSGNATSAPFIAAASVECRNATVPRGGDFAECQSRRRRAAPHSNLSSVGAVPPSVYLHRIFVRFVTCAN